MKFRLAALALALPLFVSAHAGRAADAPALAKLFGARPDAAWVSLSPDGGKIVYLAPSGPAGTAAVVADIATGTTNVLLGATSNATTPRWCGWKSDARLICQLYGIAEANGVKIAFTRLLAIGVDGSNMVELGQKSNSRMVGINADSGRVIDWLPDDPARVMLQVNVVEASKTGSNIGTTQAGASAQLADVNTGKMTPLEAPKARIFELGTDNHGNIRFASAVTVANTGYVGDTVDYFYRTRSAPDWNRIGSADLNRPASLAFLGFDASGDNLMALRPHQGRQALFSLSASGKPGEALVFAHPAVDIEGLLRIGKYDRPVAATFTVEATEFAYFDAELQRLAQSLAKALPAQPSIVISDESWSGAHKLVFAGSDSDPGRFYRFDTATKELAELVALRPKLAGLTLAKVMPVRYRAADGVEIPAYLTYPPGIAAGTPAARNLPAIVMPHGGPAARDKWGFDWIAQYFAQLGYIVLQPNFRGSSGYGEAWYARNGFQSWRTSIGDINAGARWLVAQGIADPARMAIFGWSYGGYAALQANVVDPELYKAVIAVAPVTNLAALREQARPYANFALVSTMVGEGDHVSTGSPALNAARIKAPVLMFHGDRDINVALEQSHMMDDALAVIGAKHQLITYPGLDHQLGDSAARADMLTRSAAFLAANLGAP